MTTYRVGLSATITDGLGSEVASQAYFICDQTVTMSDLVTAYGEFLGRLDGITDGYISNAKMTIEPGLGLVKGRTAPSVAGSRVEQTMLLQMDTLTSVRKHSFAVPALGNSHITAGKINQPADDAAIANYTNLLANALVIFPPSLLFTNPDGQVNGLIKSLVLAFRKRRKNLSRTSFEVG